MMAKRIKQGQVNARARNRALFFANSVSNR